MKCRWFLRGPAAALCVAAAGLRAAEPSDWRAPHLIGYDSDAALQTLGGQVPQLAGVGINVIVLEVDFSFELKSHPELRHGAHPITVDGARRLVATCRTNGKDRGRTIKSI